jgi:hypothetical protein
MMLPIAKYAQKRKTGMFGFFLKNPRKILFILILAVFFKYKDTSIYYAFVNIF